MTGRVVGWVVDTASCDSSKAARIVSPSRSGGGARGVLNPQIAQPHHAEKWWGRHTASRCRSSGPCAIPFPLPGRRRIFEVVQKFRRKELQIHQPGNRAVQRQRISWLHFKPAETALFHRLHLFQQLRLGDRRAEPPPAHHRPRIIGRLLEGFPQLIRIVHHRHSQRNGAVQTRSRHIASLQKWPRWSRDVDVAENATFTTLASVIPRRLVPLILERERPSIGLAGNTRDPSTSVWHATETWSNAILEALGYPLFAAHRIDCRQFPFPAG